MRRLKVLEADYGKEVKSRKRSSRLQVIVVGENGDSLLFQGEVIDKGAVPETYPIILDPLGMPWEKLLVQSPPGGTPGMGLAFADVDGDGQFDLLIANAVDANSKTNADAEFLKKVLADVRGTPPTTLEQKYFLEEKDPKKRENLLDMLLKDPAVAKKLGDEWKKKMLEAPGIRIERFVIPTTRNNVREALTRTPVNPPKTQQPNSPQTQATRATQLEKLVSELLSVKKTDAEMLEAVTLATVGRLPTDIEKRLTLGLVSKAGDRSAAWIEVAKALAVTDEVPKPAVSGVLLTPQKVEVVPVPPAKP
jgi:hypothetical protein